MTDTLTTPPPLPAGLLRYDGPTDFHDMERAAQLLATAKTAVHPRYRTRPGDCLTLLFRARALDVPVGVAFDHIYVNDAVGKSGLSAQLMGALLRRAGITWEPVTANTQTVKLVFFRHTTDARGRRRRHKLGASEWTMIQAKDAGLTRFTHWQMFPEDCLRARALARGCRHLFPDVVMGMGYTPEEVRLAGADGDTLPTDGNPDAIPAEVQEFLDEAATEGTTVDNIRRDIIKRAKRANLLDYGLPDGQTLQQALHAACLLALSRASDEALATPPAQSEPTVADAPAGTGNLPCNCPAEHVIRTGVHLPTCGDLVGVSA